MLPFVLSLLLFQDGATVTLEARDATLPDVFADLARQSGERFELDAALRDARVTLPRQTLSVLEAVDRVCRAHGGCRLVAPTYGGALLVVPGAAASGPARASGAFWLRLTGARATRSTDFQADRREQLSVDFQILWPRRRAPSALRVLSVDAADDTGAALGTEASYELARTIGRPAQVHAGTLLLKHPAPSARKLVRLSIEIEAWTEASARPLEHGDLAVGSAAAFAEGRSRVTRSSPAGAMWTGALEIDLPKQADGAPLAAADRLRDLALVDDAGKTYPAGVLTSLVRDGRLAVELAAQDLPRGVRLKGLRARWIDRFERKMETFAFAGLELP